MGHQRAPKRLLVYVAGSLTVSLAAWILFASGAHVGGFQQVAGRALPPGTGQPQLVSVDPLPQMTAEGEQCEWMPASASTSLAEALAEPAKKADEPVPASKRPIDPHRAPVREIR